MKTQIQIAGSSSLLSPKGFYNPIFDGLENYLVLAKKPVRIYINLHYFNSWTSEFLIQLRRICDTMRKSASGIRIRYVGPGNSDSKEFVERMVGISKRSF
jgi:hypothetical protein